jgi:hypothetical protein
MMRRLAECAYPTSTHPKGARHWTLEAPTVYRRAVSPACAANCAVIVSAQDASGDTGQNCDRGILTGNREFGPVLSQPDRIRFGLANRRLQPLGHPTVNL